jgi:ribonuclease G
MAKNLLVINVDIRETRVALIENGIIAELHIERGSSKGTLGNIYLGKVSRVLPGMQAAFIDVGLERAAFLHVEDLIRPDDFEAYLSGHRRGGEDEDRGPGPSAQRAAQRPALPAPTPSTPDREAPIELPTALDMDEGDEDVEAREDADVEDVEAREDADARDELGDEAAAEASSEQDEDTGGEDDRDDDEPAEDGGAADAEEGEDAEAVDAEADAAPDADADADSTAEAAEAAEADGAEGEDASLGATEEELDDEVDDAAETPVAAAAPTEGDVGAAPMEVIQAPSIDDMPAAGRARSGRRSRRDRVRRSGRTRDREPRTETGTPAQAAPAKAAPPAKGPQAQGRNRDRAERHGRDRQQRRHSHEPPRVSKTTPIREVVREGQEVIVQISKEPIGTKGARVTSHISLPGRYVVYLPTVDHVGISKRIGSEKERSRLRDAIEAMKPPQGGLIVRTMAEGLTKKQLKADIGYLVRLWGEIANKRESGARAPACLYTELDLVLKTARDLFTDDIEKIIIDSRDEFGRLQRFVETFMPDRAGAVELYEGAEPIFDAFGIEDEIQRALARKVPLKSGGHLIIDQAEALTAIDVNTGRFVGKGSKDLEETILTTNLEAVEEIAYQLRFRNIGGLIILDLIDMERASNREKVRRKLEELLARDKAKTTLNRISDLGLIEMTRKRTRESLGRTILEPCFYCDGTGQLQSKATIAYEILRQIRRERMNLPGYVITVNAHPAVVDLLKNDERVAVQEAERLFTRRIELVPRKEYHLEQFDLQGR